MSSKVVDESNPKQWRTELPNILVKGSKSEISVYSKWLYVYLKSVAGEGGKCWQSTKTIAKGSGISAGKVSSCKKELAEANLISIEKGDVKKGNSDTIKIRDIWGQNFKEFEDNYPRSSHEHPHSRDEHTHSSHEHTRSRHESKKNPIKKEPYEEKGTRAGSSNIPTLKEVKDYFKENGYAPSVAERAFNIYNASLEDHPKRKYWRDSRDNIIKNWKLKMQSVWFKDENKISEQQQKMSYHNRL